MSKGTGTCECCGSDFEKYAKTDRFCGVVCKKHYRIKQMNADWVKRGKRVYNPRHAMRVKPLNPFCYDNASLMFCGVCL